MTAKVSFLSVKALLKKTLLIVVAAYHTGIRLFISRPFTIFYAYDKLLIGLYASLDRLK